MTAPGATNEEPDSGYARLEQQIRWYDTKSTSAQRFYKFLKGGALLTSATVPVLALMKQPEWTAAVGIVVVVLEGLQQINQWQHNWITYRSTCESLRHEKYSYIARSGAYEHISDDTARKTLTERVEGLVSTEHSKWVTQEENAAKHAALPNAGNPASSEH